MGTLRDLGSGVRLSQTPLWQTNSLLALSGSDALLVDPGYTPAEIEALAQAARAAGGQVHVLITHGDFDHVCGIGSLPEATIVTGAATATRIESGEAVAALSDAATDWGLAWSSALRVDRVIDPGETTCGEFRVAAIEASGHTADGLAFVLVDQGVLVAGDYLSAMTYPFIGGSFAEAIATVQRLLAALERYELRWVVPGHGEPLTPGEARAVGEADLAYLEQLVAAGEEARARELSPGNALLHAFAVEPPRPTTADFEVYAIRASNARAVATGG